MYQQEEWKQIKEYPRYYVSNQGKIKSIIKGVEYILSPYYTENGYLVVQLCAETPKGERNKQKTLKVHRLVAQYFCENYYNNCEIHHIDRNRSNNNYKNLLCVSLLEHRKIHKELRKQELQKKMTEQRGKDNGGC